jgi:hypothetical protein
MSRYRERAVVSLKCKLLCPVCREIKRVVELGDLIRLECGDSRQPETLPVTPGHVSYEKLGTKLGHRLFPGRGYMEELIDRDGWN